MTPLLRHVIRTRSSKLFGGRPPLEDMRLSKAFPSCCTSRPMLHKTTRFQIIQSRFWSHTRSLLSVESLDTQEETSAGMTSIIQQDPEENYKLLSDEITSTEDPEYTAIEERRLEITRSLADSTNRNINLILDNLGDRKTGGREESSQRSLRDKWDGALKARRKLHDDRLMRANLRKMTASEVWDQSLLVAGIPLEESSIRGEVIKGVPFPTSSDGLKSSDTDGNFDEALALESKVQSQSPLLGLPIGFDGLSTESEEVDISSLDVMDEPITSDVTPPTPHVGDEATTLSTMVESQPQDEALDVSFSALSLLRAMQSGDWGLLLHPNFEPNSPQTLESAGGSNSEDTVRDDDIWQLLRHAKDHRYSLTTVECNLLLAQLLTSPALPSNYILGKSIELFRAMASLEDAGREDGIPNDDTYGMLFQALPKRLMAGGEAAKLCHDLVETSAGLGSSTYLQAMKVCLAFNEFKTARDLVEKMLSKRDSVGPTFEVCSVYLEMLRRKKMTNQAIEFYTRIREGRFLKSDKQDKLLQQLCRWPEKARGKDSSTTVLLVYALDIILEKVANGEKPNVYVWMDLINGLATASRFDVSLESEITRTLWALLKHDRTLWPGPKLLDTGLRAAEVSGDSELAAELIVREGMRESEQSLPTDDALPKSKISQHFLKKSLEICLGRGDATACDKVMGIVALDEANLPSPAVTDMKGISLLCHARAGNCNRAKDILLDISQESVISDSLAGAVLHCMVVNGSGNGADELFDTMKNNEEGLATPGVASYNAMILRQIHAHSWDDAVATFEEMKVSQVEPDSQTIQAMVLVEKNRVGIEGVAGFVQGLSQIDASLDSDAYVFIAKQLMVQLGGTIDDIRKKIRHMGEEEKSLQETSIKTIRSARLAQVEGSKPHVTDSEKKKLWSQAVQNFLEFYKIQSDLQEK